MEQEQLPSPELPNSPEVPQDRTVFGDLVSALDALGEEVRRLESHPLATGELAERLQYAEDAATLKEEFGKLCSRFGVCEGSVSEVTSRLEAVYSEATSELRRLEDTFGGISERLDAVSTRVEALERNYRESRESARSTKEEFVALRNDINSITVFQKELVDRTTKANEEASVRIAELEKRLRNNDEEIKSLKSILDLAFILGAVVLIILSVLSAR